MTPNQVLLIIIGICLIVFLVSLFKNQTDIVLRWLGRAGAGGVFIFAVNMGLSLVNMQGPVGVNVLTVGVSGILGAPGVVMLYILSLYQMLT